jgi:endoglucanase
MGEGGENNNEWYTGVFRLLEDYDISYNFWTYKKMDTTNSPYSIHVLKDWFRLSSALAQSELLSPELREQILWDYAEKVKLENCAYMPLVANAIIKGPPSLIPTIFFDWNQANRRHDFR